MCLIPRDVQRLCIVENPTRGGGSIRTTTQTSGDNCRCGHVFVLSSIQIGSFGSLIADHAAMST